MRLHYGFTVINLVLTGIGFFCCIYVAAYWELNWDAKHYTWLLRTKDGNVIDTPFKYLANKWLNYDGPVNIGHDDTMHETVSCGLLLLAAILTITIILTDLMTCCSENIKPNRRSRAIDLLLANPHSTNDREASSGGTPENPEEYQSEEINSALGEPK